MRRRIVSILALCGALALAGCGGRDDAHGARPAAGPAFRLGVVANTVGWGPRVGRQQDLVSALRVRWIREELYWWRVEPRRGERRWALYDRLFVAAAHRGLRVLPLLNDAPAWAGGRRGALPTDAAAYAEFVHDVVRRYGPSGRFWRAHPALDARLAPRWFELFNEPYFARPIESALTARRYARLADAALAAGHAADPAARFLVALQTRVGGRPGLDADWLDRLLAARPRLLADADGVAAHPYGADAEASLGALGALRDELRARGALRPIWVTEVGWTTCTSGARCVSETAQAADLSRFLRVAAGEGLADAAFVYHLLSWRVGPGDDGGGFGVLRADRTRKPAWTVLRRAARTLAPRDAA